MLHKTITVYKLPLINPGLVHLRVLGELITKRAHYRSRKTSSKQAIATCIYFLVFNY